MLRGLVTSVLFTLIYWSVLLFPSTVDSGSYQSYLLTKRRIKLTVVRLVGIEIMKQQEDVERWVSLLEVLQRK